jgi:hypothetical protein
VGFCQSGLGVAGAVCEGISLMPLVVYAFMIRRAHRERVKPIE